MIERPLYLDKIMPFVDTPFVKILTGVRRCGKSTILKMIIKKLREENGVFGRNKSSLCAQTSVFILTTKNNQLKIRE